MNLLIAAVSEAPARALALAATAAELQVVGAVPCHMLVREAVRLAPDAIVVLAETADEPLFDTLDLLHASVELPLLLSCARQPLGAVERALAAGVVGWLDAPCSVAQLVLALPLARGVFERQRRLERDLRAANERLQERKWVDRAKGVLMQSQTLSEEQAFALLRSASMHTNLRVGEVSRSVIEAAQAADAVNRVGQLRMLSQRLVKAAALVLADGPAAATEAVRRDSMQRAESAIELLAGLPLSDADALLRDAAQRAWQALAASCATPLTDLSALAEADRRAEQLLADAERLTAALELRGGRASLQVVNLCARQRMLVQRLAKQALLAGLLPAQAADVQAAHAARTVAEFDQALRELEAAPLSSEEIRAALAAARGQWRRMLAGVQRAASAEGRGLLARESEALLAGFDHLTSLYEHSLQFLMG